jgi:hypothetical protein
MGVRDLGWARPTRPAAIGDRSPILQRALSAAVLSSLVIPNLFSELGARLARATGNANERTYLASARAVMEKDVACQDTDAAVHRLYDPVTELERLDEESQGHSARSRRHLRNWAT